MTVKKLVEGHFCIKTIFLNDSICSFRYFGRAQLRFLRIVFWCIHSGFLNIFFEGHKGYFNGPSGLFEDIFEELNVDFLRTFLERIILGSRIKLPFLNIWILWDINKGSNAILKSSFFEETKKDF